MSLVPSDEKLLIQKIASGNEQAFAELFYLFKDKLFSFLLSFTDAASAEDVVQEVFLKLWTNRQSLEQVDNANAYIFRMAKNHALNSLKRAAHYQTILNETSAAADRGTHNTEETINLNQLQKQLSMAVEQLPPQQRKVYLLSREQGLKMEEIAAQLGLSYSTVKNHMISALRNLRDKLGDSHPATVIAIILAIADLLKD